MASDLQSIIDFLGIGCPSSSEFYVCDSASVRFVGCCASDPCASDGHCADEDLRMTTFDGKQYLEIPKQECVSATDGGQWFTCNEGDTFMGCCAIDPCKNRGCPWDQLRAAQLSGNPQRAEVFLNPPDPGDATTTLPGSTSTPTSTENPPPPSSGGGNGSPDTVIHAVIGAVAGVLAVVIIGALVFWCRRRGRKRRSAPAGIILPPPWQETGSPAPLSPGSHRNEKLSGARTSHLSEHLVPHLSLPNARNSGISAASDGPYAPGCGPSRVSGYSQPSPDFPSPSVFGNDFAAGRPQQCPMGMPQQGPLSPPYMHEHQQRLPPQYMAELPGGGPETQQTGEHGPR